MKLLFCYTFAVFVTVEEGCAVHSRYLSIFLFFLLCCKGLTVQSQSSPDTLQLVRRLHVNKEIEASGILLETYYENHPDDFNAIWLYAQTSYWLKQLKKSRALYEKGIQLQPGNIYFQLDYARMLLNTGSYRKAAYWLGQLKEEPLTRSAASIELAKLYYWTGENLKAKNETREALKLAPGDAVATQLLKDINIASAPWLRFNPAYQTDSQPLKNISLTLESGLSLNRLFSPYAGVYLPVFNHNGESVHSKMFVLGNKTMVSAGLGTELSYSGGVIQYPYQDVTDWIGSISLNQKITKHLSFSFEQERKPYFNTLASLDTVIVSRRLVASLNLVNDRGFSGKAAFDKSTFQDQNFVYSAYAYLLAPPVRFGKVSILLGYAFAYNDSRADQFTPVQSLPEIIASYHQGYSISGYYNPYFTPQQQSIHSAVFAMTVQPNAKFKFGTNVSPAIAAKNHNPYFFLDARGMGKVDLVKGYAEVSFHPVEASAYFEWRAGEKNVLRAEYAYHRTFFYDCNFIGLNLLSRFWK